MIPSELTSLAGALERFEAIRRRAARLGDRLCDLSYANPHPGLEARSRDVLRSALDDGAGPGLQYSPFGGHTRVRRAVADALRTRRALSFTFRDVVLTPGATAALHLALRTSGAPGEQVVIPAPCWLDYPVYVRHLGLEPVLVPLEAGTFDLDTGAVADALSPRTCAVLLSTPANPTGRVYSRDRLDELAGILRNAETEHGRTIAWISDETHRDLAPADAFHSPVASWPATFVIYSYGKYHGLQGQRAGYVAVSPRHPRRDDVAAELTRWIRIMGFGAPTALMQRAIPRLETLRHDIADLEQWRGRFLAELDAAGYDVAPADGTFFVYMAVPDGWDDDFEYVRALAEARLLALPAPVFHHRGWIRLSLTASGPVLQRALSILRQRAEVPA